MISAVYLKLGIFDCTSPETCARATRAICKYVITMQLLLFCFLQVFIIKNTYVKVAVSILCLHKLIKPKYEIIYLIKEVMKFTKFWKTKVSLKSVPAKQDRQNFVKIKKLIVFGQKNPKFEKLKIQRIPDFLNFKFLDHFGPFRNFFGSFLAGFRSSRLVSGRFALFRILVSRGKLITLNIHDKELRSINTIISLESRIIVPPHPLMVNFSIFFHPVHLYSNPPIINFQSFCSHFWV